jgi:hypothetical protein
MPWGGQCLSCVYFLVCVPVWIQLVTAQSWARFVCLLRLQAGWILPNFPESCDPGFKRHHATTATADSSYPCCYRSAPTFSCRTPWLQQGPIVVLWGASWEMPCDTVTCLFAAGGRDPPHTCAYPCHSLLLLWVGVLRERTCSLLRVEQ